jgi:hypothetical protein
MTKSVVDVCTCDECVEGNGFCARILVVVRSIIQKSSYCVKTSSYIGERNSIVFQEMKDSVSCFLFISEWRDLELWSQQIFTDTELYKHT